MENLSEPVSISIIAATAAIFGAIIAGIFSHYSNRKRNSFEARVEICKYREKWLEQLRSEIVSLNTLSLQAVDEPLTGDKERVFFENMSRVTLLVSDTNPHYDALRDSMEFVTNGLVYKENYGEELAAEFEKREPFLLIAKRILKEEWNEIQDLLYKERNKKNAKNK